MSHKSHEQGKYISQMIDVVFTTQANPTNNH